MKAVSFSFENQPVRTLGTSETPLFIASDVCDALGYKRSRDAVAQHVDPEDLIKAEIDTAGGRQTVNCVNESGLYALIFGSQLESAKRFKRWVTSVVLPSIRKTGGYAAGSDDLNFNRRLNANEAKIIREEVAERYRQDRTKYRVVYDALRDHFGVGRYTSIPANRLEEAILFIRNTDFQHYAWTSSPSANNGGSLAPTASAAPVSLEEEFVTAIGRTLLQRLPSDPEEFVRRLLYAATIVEAGRHFQNVPVEQLMSGRALERFRKAISDSFDPEVAQRFADRARKAGRARWGSEKAAATTDAAEESEENTEVE